MDNIIRLILKTELSEYLVPIGLVDLIHFTYWTVLARPDNRALKCSGRSGTTTRNLKVKQNLPSAVLPASFRLT